MHTTGSHQGYWDIWGCGNTKNYMEGQEQEAHFEDQTDVLSSFDCISEYTSWNIAKRIEITWYIFGHFYQWLTIRSGCGILI